eukprot:gene10114-12406_t
MSKNILVMGGNGALGASIVNLFKTKGWAVTSVDFSDNKVSDHSFVIKSSNESEIQNVEKELTSRNLKFDSIVCAAGGFTMGGVKSEGFFGSVQKMIDMNFSSAVATAYLAGKFLTDQGVLVLTGAVSALSPTPALLGYGMTKAATHHLVKSLAVKDSGVNGTTLAILPVILDTPANRSAMPGSNFDDWTKVDEIAAKLFEWSSSTQNRPESGSLVKIETKSNSTTFTTVN